MEENKIFDFAKYRTATDTFVGNKPSIWNPNFKKTDK